MRKMMHEVFTYAMNFENRLRLFAKKMNNRSLLENFININTVTLISKMKLTSALGLLNMLVYRCGNATLLTHISKVKSLAFNSANLIFS